MSREQKKYEPRRFKISADDGRQIEYKIEDMDPDDAFDLLLDLAPIGGAVLGGLGGLKSVSDDGPLVSLAANWIGVKPKSEADPESESRPSASIDDNLMPYLRAIGELASPELASMPGHFASVLRASGGSRVLRRLLSSCHRFDPVSKAGGWVGEGDNFKSFYRGNLGEAMRAAFYAFNYTYKKMLKLGK